MEPGPRSNPPGRVKPGSGIGRDSPHPLSASRRSDQWPLCETIPARKTIDAREELW